MTLEIVCTAYERPVLLMTQLCSLAAQTVRNFKILVFHDGYNAEIERVVAKFKDMYPNIDVRFRFSDVRYNDYGHSLREIALSESSAEYMLLTNDDNYYTPNFLEDMMPALISGGYDISYCNMIHSHEFLDPNNPNGYQPLRTGLRLGAIDIGAFIFDTKLGQRVGFSNKSFEADGHFLEGLIALGARAYKVEKYLFVHN
jgi:glycosyltransferase involved in cell wall biosynthesis